MQWKPIDTAPFNRDLELAVLDSTGTHIVAFPCRLTGNGWIDTETNKQVYYIRPRTGGIGWFTKILRGFSA
jgi:hypothetical protein